MKPLTKLLHTLSAALVLTLSAPALSADEAKEGLVIPEAVKGEQCVEDTEVMRRNHMDYLLQHRDATLREGIRTKKYSLKECLECHVPAGEQNSEAERGEGNHFCKNCHTYAGVKIDCFECHATRPQKSVMFHPLVTPGMQAAKEAHQQDSTELLNKAAGAQSETDAQSETGAAQ
jgi:predicted CXXCH cytochrome family protein